MQVCDLLMLRSSGAVITTSNRSPAELVILSTTTGTLEYESVAMTVKS